MRGTEGGGGVTEKFSVRGSEDDLPIQVYEKFILPIEKTLKTKKDAQVGIRIRVDCVTGNHDRPLHYLGKFTVIPPPRFEPGTSR
jgi:hypothetical protein